jgi:hypothetical protein
MVIDHLPLSVAVVDLMTHSFEEARGGKMDIEEGWQMFIRRY